MHTTGCERPGADAGLGQRRRARRSYHTAGTPHAPPPHGLSAEVRSWRAADFCFKALLTAQEQTGADGRETFGQKLRRGRQGSERLALGTAPEAGPPRAASGCVCSHTGRGGSDEGVTREAPALGASAAQDQLAGQFRLCQGCRFARGTGRLRCVSVQATSVSTVYVPGK